MKIYVILLLSLLSAQFPVDLIPDEISDPLIYQVEQDNEFLLTLTASTNTNWSLQDSESATLVVVIDGDWENYNQDIVLYAGDTNHEYYVSLGYLEAGEHAIEFWFDYGKSSIGANNIHIESVDIIDIASIDMDPDIFLHSPILYGRDLLSWNESIHTDIPLIMFYETSPFIPDMYGGYQKTITYSIIFSNEDSRVGLGLSDLMFSYGRTTDIEWMYEVVIDENNNIISEIFQGASHTTTDFSGEKISKHPILKNATLNCNFTDSGTSNYKFFLSPLVHYSMPEVGIPLHTREIIMDEHPWTYRIMGEELINEERYEENPNPETVEMSDVRNYVYIQYSGNGNADIILDLAIKLHGGCETYFHTHNSDVFSSNYYSGARRTSIELPENFDPMSIASLGLLSSGDADYSISLADISRFFYLDSNYTPIDIPIVFSEINLNNDNPNHWITINENLMNLDCFGEENGNTECDECGVCNGNDTDIDNCGVCFGNNNDMDCTGACFGTAQLDECGICDDDTSNDNLTCSGCTDVNADNFDENAFFYDQSCIYSDNIFLVPTEYNSIQNAIFFASDGDTVEVGEGTYQENLHFLEKSITVKSQDNLETWPTIEGVDSLSTITIENSSEASLIGFTITGGYGSGVSFDDFISLAADPSAFDSLLTQVLRGGGLSIINSSPYLKDLYITENTSRNVGAGIGLINSSAVIESTVIENNHIPDGDALGGGGIAINGGSPTLIDVEIGNNTVGQNMYYLNGGGGILCGFSFEGSPLELNMYNTTIYNNTANIGAGIGVLSGNIYMERTIIESNTGNFGSALSMGEPLGLVVGDIAMNIVNSTIAMNSGTMTVGLINSAYLNILNSIFWENTGDYEFAPMPNNDMLNIQSAYSRFNNDLLGEGNIDTDPAFSDEYFLTQSSPCINAGTDYFDFGDNNIINIDTYNGAAPDMGRYEFSDNSCDEASGDINLDGMLDILDILTTVNIIMGFSESTELENCIADINQDNIIDIFDIIIMINIILSN